MEHDNRIKWIGISEITSIYLPISKKKARQFVSLYLNPIKIGNRIFVERDSLEALLKDGKRDCFPLEL